MGLHTRVVAEQRPPSLPSEVSGACRGLGNKPALGSTGRSAFTSICMRLLTFAPHACIVRTQVANGSDLVFVENSVSSKHVRIRPDDLVLLRQLAKDEDRPMVAVLTAALKAYAKNRAPHES